MRSDAKKNYDHILQVAHIVVTEQGADASLRDIARRADIGLGTLYRHFPTREALLDALLRSGFDELTTKAQELETASSSDAALLSWLREVVTGTGVYQGIVTVMVAAMEDTESALHASCAALRAAGARLLVRAQAEGLAHADIDGDDLFSLIAALAWLSDQPASAPRAEHHFNIIASSILTSRASGNLRTQL
ncbi:helix-turn-helix domain-containing protein [Saccharibacillus sp. CPCC 101409]|uniref:TetR/AcrR family transcriptional regulator n=1 Tax=Saccharibacillus sp. CPCC 101409 TaxID=3058041 RepID=UPI0026715198|nr:TetR/AcrR family transcriptional regulator [Saccharibacillus sp. CPCC 101409]MDO3409768.1 helix-turn-helix domain-containing protein [Saccharibacillus sp. CPCC 101409]